MNTSKVKTMKNVLSFYAFLFVVWGFYRFLFQFPAPLEEIIFKPIVWLLPLIYFYKKEKLKLSDLGFSFKNIFHVIYFVIFLGFLFTLAAMLVNYLKYGSLNFNANIGEMTFISSLALSFLTAFSEEVTFRGYIFGRVWSFMQDEWKANLVTSIGWTLIHIPVAIFDWNLGLTDSLIFLAIIFAFSFGTTFVYAKTKNIAAPILLHVLWQWPIILFR